MIVSIVFSVVPVVFTVVDLSSIQSSIENFWLANLFYSHNIISGVLSGIV